MTAVPRDHDRYEILRLLRGIKRCGRQPGQPVKAYCAWCREEGRTGNLGEREPFEDPGETHGVCDRHQQQLLSTLPSTSVPGIQLLVIIASGEPTLYAFLQGRLASVKGVGVMMERRRGDRRQQASDAAYERRRRDRRVRRGQTSALGYTLVRFGKSPADSPAAAPID